MGDSRLDLDAIEARANAATPGRWAYRGIHSQADRGECEFGEQAFRFIEGDGDEYDEGPSDADVEFIAAAREDVPALVAEVRRLRWRP